MIKDQELIRRAFEIAKPKQLSTLTLAAEVGAALITDKGNIYVGASIETTCGLGLCAEHTAIGNMITNCESRIHTIVAVDHKNKILSPCGRCREMIYQIDKGNAETRVLLKNDKSMKLKDLLPEYWFEE